MIGCEINTGWLYYGFSGVSIPEWTMCHLFVTHDPSDPLHTWPMIQWPSDPLRDPVTQQFRLIKKCKGNYFRVNSVQSKSFFAPFDSREKVETAHRKKLTEMHCIFMHTYIIISIRSWSIGMGHWIKRSWPMTHRFMWPMVHSDLYKWLERNAYFPLRNKSKCHHLAYK